MSIPIYEATENGKSTDGVKYIFITKGNSNTVKAIDYSYARNLYGMKIYNLAFGVYNPKNDTIDDTTVTANGDVYAVFNTVLSTIPKFFKSFQNAVIIVKGSDSSVKFVQRCKLTCRKNCSGICKNQHRRIKAYNNYIAKNYDALKKDYSFLGGILDLDDQTVIEKYIPKRMYNSILVLNNNV